MAEDHLPRYVQTLPGMNVDGLFVDRGRLVPITRVDSETAAAPRFSQGSHRTLQTMADIAAKVERVEATILRFPAGPDWRLVEPGSLQAARLRSAELQARSERDKA